MRIRFDHGPLGAATRFDEPQRLIRAERPDQVAEALSALDRARSEGYWLAGYASYELGYALEAKLADLMPAERRLPLLQFGVYEAPEAAEPLPKAGIELTGFAPRWDAPRYREAFRQVHDWIGSGDIYQANLTFPIDVELAGEAAEIYAAMAARQPVGHGVLIEQEGGPDILSRSPELFFSTDQDGRIQTRPMKGTQPRSDDADEDARRERFLTEDEKNQAENLMIVDLLRNDISRVCKPGSVRVPELFKVESYQTVHQMVSLVEGHLAGGMGLAEILTALFPCGSITGAPKVRAMQVICELEPWPREIYCGSIGWAAPDGRASFNVAIRTLTRDRDGAGVLNVGGGLVWDSTATSEYEEALWKARFLSQFRPEPG